MTLNKSLAALLVFVFAICTLVVVLTWSVGSEILNAEAYVLVLEEAGFFEAPYQLIRDGEIPAAGGLLLQEGPLSVISGADLETAARELAPPDWLHAQLKRAVRDLVAIADASELNELPDLVISLREVKARALGEPGNRALSIAVEALPVCAPGRTPLELDSDVPICRPPDADLNPFLVKLKAVLVPLVERVPDTYRVSWQPEQRDVLEELQRAGRTLDRLQFALVLLIALNLALMGLVWLLAVRSPAEWLRWTGMPMLLLGLLTLVAGLLTPRAVIWELDNRALWVEGQTPLALAHVLEVAIRDLTLLLFRRALYVGVVLSVIGLLLMLASPLFPGRRRTEIA